MLWLVSAGRISLATAMGMLTIGAVFAADPIARKPQAVEYVRACQNPLWPGAGGFIVPGSQTCLRLFGQARFDYEYRHQFFVVTSTSGYRGTSMVGVDVITPSEYGTVRALAQVSMIYRSGEQRNATAARQGFAVDGPFGDGIPGQNAFRGGQTELAFQGFVQFAGFTAGRTASFFEPLFVTDIIGTASRVAPTNINLIGYTVALGQGVTATLSLEDGLTRRLPILNATPGRINFDYLNTAANFLNQGSNALPHLVGALQVNQAWGSAKLSGVVTSIRPAGLVPAAGIAAAVPSTKFGFAVSASARINLPTIAPGDNLALMASYGEGALQYSYPTFMLSSVSQQNLGGVGWNIGDAAFNAATGQVKLAKFWLVAAGFQHFWTPSVSSNVFAAYRSYRAPFAPTDARDSQRDGKVVSFGVNTIWTPVRGLSIALEGGYVVTDPKGRVPDINRNSNFAGINQIACNALVSNCFTKSAQQQLIGHLRIMRDF
jgi:Porin subfamily